MLFSIPAFLITYVVLIRSLSKNGHSAVWALLPVTIVLLLVVRAVVVRHDSNNTVAIVGLAAGGIELACLAGWLSLLVIVGLRWSAKRKLPNHGEDADWY